MWEPVQACPGLPLAIINPTKQFVLLDSLGKRISFIRNAVRELGLTNVEPVLSRVEEYQSEQKFDGVLSRAFASLKDMTDWCIITKTRWIFLCFKRHLSRR